MPLIMISIPRKNHIRLLIRRSLVIFIPLLLISARVPASPSDNNEKPVSDNYVWWEAEASRDSNLTTVGPFRPLDANQRAKLSNGSWLNGKYEEGAYAEYVIDVPETGRYYFYARKFSYHGPFRWRFDDGPWHVQDKPLYLLDSVELRKYVAAAWVLAGTVDLDKGRRIFRIEMIKNPQDENDKAFGLDCFALTRRPFFPAGKLKPSEKSGLAEPGKWAFEPDADNYSEKAMLDLRYLNEGVAGEGGFVKRRGDKFYLGNGKDARFWAVNVNNRLADMRSLESQARHLAKLGVNQVRLFYGYFKPLKIADGSPEECFDDDVLDGTHRMVAAFKKSGIYSDICFYWRHIFRIRGKWNVPGYPENSDATTAVVMFDPVMKQVYKDMAGKIFTTKNPYTGISLAEDPAVSIVELQNEDSFFWSSFHPSLFKPEQWDALGKLFGDFLKKKYGSLDRAYDRWGIPDKLIAKHFSVTRSRKDGQSFEQKDDPAKGIVLPGGAWLMNSRCFAAGSDTDTALNRRIADQIEFLTALQYDFYKEMEYFLRHELGVKSLISGGNWRAFDPLNLEDIERYTYTANEVIDRHVYFGGVHVNPADSLRANWDVQDGDCYTDRTVLFEPLAFGLKYKQVRNYPSAVSELCWYNPNGYLAEAPILAAAYGSMIDLDSVTWFAANSVYYDDSFVKFPVSVPSIMGQFPAAALLYRKGYVTEAPVVVYERRSLTDMYNKKKAVISEAQRYDSKGVTRFSRKETLDTPDGEDPMAFLIGKVEVSYGRFGHSGRKVLKNRGKHIDYRNKTARSLTGELSWRWGSGICTVDAEKAQGVTGFLAKAGKINLTDVAVESKNDYGSVVVVALDDMPLAKSKKMLAQAMTQSRPYGWKEEDRRFKDGKVDYDGKRILNKGSYPYNVKNIDVLVTFRGRSGLKATALDLNGYPRGPVKIESVSGKGSVVKLPEDTLYTIIER